MDNLKKHIKQHRAELDKIEAPKTDKIWAGIQGELQKDAPVIKKTPNKLRVASAKSSRRFTLWTIAAAASVALLIGVGLGYFMTPTTANNQDFNLANYAPEAAEQANNYQRLVANKKAELDFQNLDTLAFSEVLQELKALDGEYALSLIHI